MSESHTIYPSLDAYKASIGRAVAKAEADPLGRFVAKAGPGSYWATGAVRVEDGKPLPVVVEVIEKPRARELAQRGARPLADADPELLAMIAPFFAERVNAKSGQKVEIPAAFVPFVGGAPKAPEPTKASAK